MTQATLANGLGVSYQLIQKYENGDYHIGAGRLTKLPIC